MDKNIISTYLYLGYLPEIPVDISLEVWCKYINKDYQQALKHMNEEDLINLGVNALKSSYSKIEKGLHVLPLSGGLDSRAILGGLIEAGMAENTVIFTFGSPGTFDFEIGKYLARKYRLQHEVVDLTQNVITQDALLETSKNVNSLMWLFDVYYNRLVTKIFGKNAIYWSGFLAGCLAGNMKVLPEQKSEKWEDAIKWFISRHKFVGSINLVHPQFSLAEQLPKKPFLGKDTINYDEQLNYAIRQNYIKRVLKPEGYNYKMPFLCPQWVEFIVNIPVKYREHKKIYKKILASAYPALFKEPTKPTNLGDLLKIRNLPFNSKICIQYFLQPHKKNHPLINYVDFKKSLMVQREFKEMIYNNIKNLHKRGLIDWLDILDLWEKHQKGYCDHALALTVLASLEIYCKTHHDIK